MVSVFLTDPLLLLLLPVAHWLLLCGEENNETIKEANATGAHESQPSHHIRAIINHTSQSEQPSSASPSDHSSAADCWLAKTTEREFNLDFRESREESFSASFRIV